jgi:HD superfamily phosphohydrolase
MIINDKVFWEIDITEPVILALINSSSIQRLKWIDMAWYFEQYFPWTKYSRFDHSIGVYHVLNIYWAPIEEQIAWLIHDVSHSAFSHCADYVLSGWSEHLHDFQDNIFNQFVRDSEIPGILSK